MTQSRELNGILYEGIPPVEDFSPTGIMSPTGGLLAVLVLIVEPGVEVEDFAARYRMVPRDQIARAVDSQARWTLETDGRVTIQLLCEESAARIVIPSDPRVHLWTGMARLNGGSLSLIVIPGLPRGETLGYYLGPHGGPYWHLSVGCIPL
ncbi:hypothetical protein [Streptomyces sp. NPDC087538]|uniref:hypothetical protein n=1 Tax=Streptomyces sp. NPDC087538 TaxID=3365797 RepID=UPI00380DAD44